MIPYINAPFSYLSNVLGASVDEIKLITSFLLSYPLAALLKRLPDNRPDLKNWFIVAVGLFYLIGLFDLWAGVRTLFISSAGAYAISYYIHGPYMPWIAFVFLMGHMSVNHIRRHIVNDASLVDITGAQMVMVMKLTAFCWNVHDGRLDEKLLDAFQKEHALKNLPNLLDYAAYVLFFPSLHAGPAFDYVEYRRWLETSMFDLPPGTDPAKAPRTNKNRRIPRSGRPALFKCVTGLAWLFAFLQFAPRYPPSILLSSKYMAYSLPRRMWLMHMVGFAVRLKYYAVWTLTEGACILSGIGYKGVDPATGRPNWDRLQNVNPLAIELAQNSRAYLASWNINTNNWLRNYMYLRVTPRGRKPGFRASLATFVTSAFWHGFEAGYYMAFVLAAFVQTVAKNCRRLFRPFFLEPDGTTATSLKPFYDFVSWLVTQLAISFTVTPFILLSFRDSLHAWAAVYYYCILGVVAGMIFFSSPSPARHYLKKRLAARTRPPKIEITPDQSEPEKKPAKLQVSPSMSRTSSSGSFRDRGPLAGLPDDPGRELDEILEEVKREVELRRSRGQSIGSGLQEVLQEKIKDGKLDSTQQKTK